MKIELPENVAIKAVRDLVLKLSTKGQSLGLCPVRSWKEDGKDSILVDIERNRWRSLADALAHRLRADESYAAYANDFEAVSKMSDRRSRGRRSWAKVTPFLFMR